MADLTIRPNGAGNQQGWNAEGGDYTRVDEVSSDGDTTRLYSPTANAVATFAMENHTSESGAISNVRVYIKTRGLDPISNVVQLAVRIGGTDYFSGNKTYNNTSYHDEFNDWATNPNSGVAWTWTDIDNLEAGMKRISGGGQAVTQVWAVVTYSAGTASNDARSARITGKDTASDARSAKIKGAPDLDDFGYRKLATVDADLVSGSGDQTNRPVLVKIASDNDLRTVANGGHVENSNGYDIVFALGDGTVLDHEIESYDPTTGKYNAIVKLPSLDGTTDTEFYMYYGNSGISTSPESKFDVYDSNYKGVWNMKEDPSATTIKDSTRNAYHMTVNGSMTSGDLVDGPINKAIDFDGSDDYLINTAWASIINGNGARTISAFFYASSFPNANWISWGAASGNALSSMAAFGGNIGYAGFGNDNLVAGGAYDDSAWHKMSITHDGTTMKILIDGTEVFSGSETLATSTLADLYFGRYVGGAYFPGRLSWIRISNIARSNDWEITDYNMETNASFITWGAEEELGATDVSDDRDAKITGKDSANAARSARITGKDTANDARSGHITGTDTDDDSRGARITGAEGANASREARITGQDTANAARGARIAGQDTSNAVRGARITGKDVASDNRPAHITGQDSTSDMREARITGKDSATAFRGARITGSDGANDSRGGRVTGTDATNDSRPAHITGKDTAENSRSARITGTAQATDNRSARIAGRDTAFDIRLARITGKDTANAVRGARISGSETSLATRGARITGIHRNPYTPSADPYTPSVSPYEKSTSPYTKKATPYQDKVSPFSRW